MAQIRKAIMEDFERYHTEEDISKMNEQEFEEYISLWSTISEIEFRHEVREVDRLKHKYSKIELPEMLTHKEYRELDEFMTRV
jgi:hypothetical protein